MKAYFYNTTEMLVAFSNEITVDEDGWAQIAPFGDFPGMALLLDDNGGFKQELAIQRMDRKAVETMVAEFQNNRRGARKFLRSRPIYLGHPDKPGGEKRYPDKKPKGVFANVALREAEPGKSKGGFYGELVLTDEGEELVATGKVRALSGRWAADEYVGEELIGGKLMKVFRPTQFLSAGLTDRPNLPVELFNEAETTERDQMPKSKVIALLASLGILTVKGATFTNEASDEDVSEGLKQLGEQAKNGKTLEGERAQFANEKAELQGKLTTAEGKVATLTTEKGTLATERDTARTQFANERQARITGMLDQAIKEGRITAAERPTWEGRLKVEAQFANEAETLGKLEAKTKTTSVTLQRGDRKVEISNASERREMVSTLVNEEMTSTKCAHDAALARVQGKYPQLFEGMKEPKLQMPHRRK